VQDDIKKLEGLIKYLNDQSTDWGYAKSHRQVVEKNLVE
jgi:hypothetical protein